MTNRVQAEADKKHAKPRMSLLPGDALMAIADVLTYGATKYADDSWKAPPFKSSDYLDALLRHAAKRLEGEVRDAESGRLHAAHMATNAMMYLWYELRGTK